jgi:excisionase family DNA binding protein
VQPRASTLVTFRSATSLERRSRTFTVVQTAALLGATKSTTLRLIREGAIPARRRAGRIEIRRSVFAYLAEVQS